MAQSALTPVEFHGATLSVTLISGVPHIALKPICEAIGLDWKAQQDRIKRHPVLNSVAVVTTSTGTDGKRYEMLMLPLDKLDGWLFGVSVRRVRPELRERLTQYQAECFDALARHFGSAVPRPVDHVPGAGNMMPTAASVNIHAAPASIDPRALLLGGQSEPVPLTAAQQALIDAKAWGMAREAYELSRQHLARRVAYSSRPAHRNDLASTEVADIVASTTLGNALAHEWHGQIHQLEQTARLLARLSADTFADLQKIVRQTGGQGAAAGLDLDI